MSSVLLVEDDESLAEGVAFNLRNTGYEVETVESGEAALERIEQRSFDLILLDLMLPGIDGLEVLRQMRRSGDTRPVIIVTARDRADDTIAGLDAGADDYLTKPFDLDELLARIRGTLRRLSWTRAAQPKSSPESLQYGGWHIDFATFEATHEDGRTLSLTVTEAAILKFFAQRPGEVISRATFLQEVWGRSGSLETRTVDNFVRKLRHALEPHPNRPQHIVSVRGAGYKFVP